MTVSPPNSAASHGARASRRGTWLLVIGAVLVVLIVVLGGKWREGTNNGGQLPAEPFTIAGNFHYVGASDAAAFLITSPAGHVLIDGGYPGTAAMIEHSVQRLGFRITDVKVLLNSEPHFDHAGGLAELQRKSGARIHASEASAETIASGGDDPDIALPMRGLIWSGILRYPPARVDRVLKDRDTVQVGPLVITAHLTPGHTRGCTSFSFPVQDGTRTLIAVSACSLAVMQGMRYDGYRGDFERTFERLRSIPADIWVTSHARLFGRYRKFAARDTASDPVAPFIDRAGYRAYIDSGEARFRRGQTH